MDMSSNDAQAPSSRKKSSFRSLPMVSSDQKAGASNCNAIISCGREMAREYHGPRRANERGPFGHSFKKTAALVSCIHMEKRILSDKLHSFFSNIIRRSFWQLGINDAAVVGYVADVLTDFAKSDNLY